MAVDEIKNLNSTISSLVAHQKPLGGTPDQISEGETGFLVPPADPEALAAALKQLIENPRLRESMGRAARTRIETRFPISETIRKIETHYRNSIS